MARLNEEDYVEPTPSGTPEQVKTAAALEGLLAAQITGNKAIINAGGQAIYNVNATKQSIETLTNPAAVSTPPTVDTASKTPTKPAINDRSQMPSEDPGEGYKWQWISMAYANNPYGGEWRRYKVTTGTSGGGAPAGSPGAAWIWNGTSWTKPAMPQDGKVYTWNDNSGWTVSDLNTGPTKSQVDSIAAIGALLSSYGIGDLTDAITKAVVKGYTSDTIQLIMQDPNSNDPLALAFQKRFPANKARLAAGKTVLSASEYLAAERTYSQIFQSYGLAGMASRDYFNKFIEGDVSAAEVSDRIGLAVNRVQNADQTVRDALKNYYPMLNQADIVGAMLNPTEGLPSLQRKVLTAEIGGAGAMQGLNIGLGASLTDKTGYANVTSGSMGAEALAALGITQAQAKEGFGKIAEIAPRSEFLSSISQGADYTAKEAEQEVFQGLASAKRKREQLTALEAARFSGSAGTTKGSLASRSQGAF